MKNSYFFSVILLFNFIVNLNSIAGPLEQSTNSYQINMPSSQQDQWGDTIRASIANYKRPDEDTFVSTILASCDYRPQNLERQGVLEKTNFSDPALEKDLPTHILYKSRFIRFYYDQQEEKRKRLFEIEKAPLFIFLPGIFSKVDGPQPTDYMKRLNRLGYHVASFPNPLHKSFVKLKSNYLPGDLVNEAKTLYRSIISLIEYLKSKDVLEGKVYLAGVSYGSFLSAVITAMDGDSNKVITGGTTLISPPENFGVSVTRLDQFIDETMSAFGDDNFTERAFRFLRVCTKDTDNTRRKWAKGLTVFSGFQIPLTDSIRSYQKTYDLSARPMGIQNWREIATFNNYFNWYAPELISVYQSEVVSLRYWVEKAIDNGQRIRILTAKDDWLNPINAWESYSKENLLMIEKGGHYGFHHTRWFSSLINNLYQIKD